MTRYRGVDWRTHRDTKCNDDLNPQVEQMNDGLDLDLLEVVFVKAREFQHVHSLARYTEYFTGKEDLTSNEFNSPRMQLAFEEECTALKRRVEQCHVGVVDEKNAL